MYTLIIDTTNDPLHYYEFVKPVEKIIKRQNKTFKTLKYSDIKQSDINNSERIIICGTSLKDFDYSKDINIKKFEFLKAYNKPVLGICAGMQIIGLIFSNKLKKSSGIGLKTINLNKEFLGLSGEIEVYELHNMSISLKGFDEYSRGYCYQKGNLYAVLFHPEVRNGKIIETFLYR